MSELIPRGRGGNCSPPPPLKKRIKSEPLPSRMGLPFLRTDWELKTNTTSFTQNKVCRCQGCWLCFQLMLSTCKAVTARSAFPAVLRVFFCFFSELFVLTNLCFHSGSNMIVVHITTALFKKKLLTRFWWCSLQSILYVSIFSYTVNLHYSQLYLFIALSVILTEFQGHTCVKEF